jgi:hypothetical protein
VSVIELLRVVFALVFGYAAAQKSRNPASARAATVDLGVPAGLAGPAVALLVMIEAGVASGMAIRPVYRVAAATGAVLLAVVTLVLVANLLRGNRPACACFGVRSGRPIGRTTVVRNLALLVLAVVVAASPPALGAPLRLDNEAGPWTVAAVALILSAGSLAIVVLLLRRHGALLTRVDELAQRLAPFDDISYVVDESVQFIEPGSGRLLTVSDLALDGVSRLLLVDPDCPGCQDVLGRLAEERDTGLVVASRDPARVLTAGRAIGYDHPAVATRLGCPGVPCLVHLTEDGVPGSQHVGSGDVLAALAERNVGQAVPER